MALAKIKQGDEVVVIAGRDKGKRGVVKEKLKGGRLKVEGVNQLANYVRRNPQAGIEGGIFREDGPIHVSNVMVVNPNTDKGERVGVKTLEDGRKVRYFKKSGEVVEDSKQ